MSTPIIYYQPVKLKNTSIDLLKKPLNLKS